VKRAKLAIVTGASSGIGADVGQVLAAAGMQVFLIGRNPQKLASAMRRIPAGRRAGSATVDLRSLTDVRRLLRELRQRHPRIDVLVHCAGEYHRSQPGGADGEAFNLMFEVNVRAPYLITQGLAPQLERAAGQVVFLNSSIVRNPGRGVAAYKATQHAVQGLTDSLREDMNKRGVRVSSLFPGRTATPLMRRIYRDEGKPYKPKLLLSAREVAQLVLMLTQLPPRVEITDLNVRSVTPY
jgi:NADP-dependent 3-hydroxy acid dehydrogenase YdfG